MENKELKKTIKMLLKELQDEEKEKEIKRDESKEKKRIDKLKKELKKNTEDYEFLIDMIQGINDIFGDDYDELLEQIDNEYYEFVNKQRDMLRKNFNDFKLNRINK